MHIQQLPLDIRLQNNVILKNFCGKNNEFILVEFYKLIEAHETSKIFYLWGSECCGRSHLLQGVCNYVNSHQKVAMYLPFSEVMGLSYSILEDLEYSHLICIDDVDTCFGDLAWEERLFDLYNRCVGSKCHIIVSAKQPYNNYKMALQDLQSRLAAGICYQVQELDDADKLQVVIDRAQDRGLILTAEVAQFILRHFSRNLKNLFKILDILDNASLAAKRKLTIPFVKNTLEQHFELEEAVS